MYVITDEHIQNGLLKVKWPSRLELVEYPRIIELLPPNSELYIDGAHNAAGARTVADFLSEKEAEDGIPSYIINGRTKDTDLHSFLKEFVGKIAAVAAVRVKLEALPESPIKIDKAAKECELESFIASGIKDAITKIVLHANKIDINDESVETSTLQKAVRICICGSFYLARDLKYESER